MLARIKHYYQYVMHFTANINSFSTIPRQDIVRLCEKLACNVLAHYPLFTFIGNFCSPGQRSELCLSKVVQQIDYCSSEVSNNIY